MPKGVFNLVNGLGPDVGVAMSEHPDIDMISFTGSTRAGIDVAKRAANTVKRVSQELGGKSPNVILEGADFVKAVTGGVAHMFNNSGQSCNAPSRMIVPAAKMKEIAAIAKAQADKTKAGDPRADGTVIGPVVNRGQWDKIQGLIQKGIDEGATLVAGGPGLPEGVNKGFYVRPTIFADVTRPGRTATSEPPKSTQHPLKQFCAHRLVFVERGRLVHRDETVGSHVRHDDPRDTQRKLHARRDLSERLQATVAKR